MEMTSKGLGMTGVIDEQNNLVGVYTDGDLRRSLEKSLSLDGYIGESMSASPITIETGVLAAELVALMKTKRISGILVTEKGRLVGAINMQDLLRAGVL